MNCIFLTGNKPSLSVGKISIAPVSEPPVTPADKWPLWAKALRLLRANEDKGLGDTAVHVIGDANSTKFKKWFQETFNRSCGCSERQAWLNKRFPYRD